MNKIKIKFFVNGYFKNVYFLKIATNKIQSNMPIEEAFSLTSLKLKFSKDVDKKHLAAGL